MAEIEFSELAGGYKERMRRLALFEPLHELERKREQDQEGTNVDMKGLGLLSLLFFFEQKLMRQYKVGVMQLTTFLKANCSSQYKWDDEKWTTLARTIIQTFRPATGRKRSYSFFDWETKKDDVIEYSILKANSFDLKTNTQYFTLDEDGLELLFATKEFYSEFQLSINQLMLRKQIEKGEFQGALRQINEMRIDVETLEARLEKLNHEIKRSIVSEETFERYKALLDDIYGRLEREDEEFKELRSFIQETRERLFAKNDFQKEQRSFNLIIRIVGELEKVHHEHSSLLKQSLTLRNTTLITAQESLYYTGVHLFNFDQDIVSSILSAPLPVDAMKGILHPFLKVEENNLWSPLTLLAEQRLEMEKEEQEQTGFLDFDEREGGQAYRKWISSSYRKIMEHFLMAYEEGKGESLSQFVKFLKETGEGEMLEKGYFYYLWLILHQRSPIFYSEGQSESQAILDEALILLENKTLVVTELRETLRGSKRFSIQDMSLELINADAES
jgi:hypothetical protein